MSIKKNFCLSVTNGIFLDVFEMRLKLIMVFASLRVSFTEYFGAVMILQNKTLIWMLIMISNSLHEISFL